MGCAHNTCKRYHRKLRTWRGQYEIRAMVFWNGEPTAQVFKADEQLNAMLLERCEPGTSLQIEPEKRQDIVIVDLLRRLFGTTHVLKPCTRTIDLAWEILETTWNL
jgi:streptomycin 6-kinase